MTLRKIVLTGAAGALGHLLREPLSRMCERLLSTDIAPRRGDLLPNEDWARADLARMEEVAPLMEGAEMVVHFGAIVDERPFMELLGPNFVGAYNVWEAAHAAGARRIIYASSIHAVGMWEVGAGIGPDVPHRPDTFYGLAKCFAEDLARLYWEKRGMEAVCLRILSAVPEPQNARHLGTWLSYPDLIHLVERAVDTPVTGFTVVYGVSANDRCPVDNARAAFLGYRPKDNAEWKAPELLAAARPDPTDLAQSRLGGPFASGPLGQGGLAAATSGGITGGPAAEPAAAEQN